MDLVQTQYAIVAVLGFMLGAAELMGRYRDDPINIFRCMFAWYYALLNAGLSVVALFLIESLGLSFTPADVAQTTVSDAVFNVITAGFGGAAFFRSSVMKAKSGDKDIAIGPAIVIDTLLNVTDREVDRYRAIIRAREITRLMQYLTPREVSVTVVPFCQRLMQNLSASEREKVNKELEALLRDTADIRKPKEAQTLAIGLGLVELTSFDVLAAAIEELRRREYLPTEEEARKARAAKKAAEAEAARLSAEEPAADDAEEIEETAQAEGADQSADDQVANEPATEGQATKGPATLGQATNAQGTDEYVTLVKPEGNVVRKARLPAHDARRELSRLIAARRREEAKAKAEAQKKGG